MGHSELDHSVRVWDFSRLHGHEILFLTAELAFYPISSIFLFFSFPFFQLIFSLFLFFFFLTTNLKLMIWAVLICSWLHEPYIYDGTAWAGQPPAFTMYYYHSSITFFVVIDFKSTVAFSNILDLHYFFFLTFFNLLYLHYFLPPDKPAEGSQLYQYIYIFEHLYSSLNSSYLAYINTIPGSLLTRGVPLG